MAIGDRLSGTDSEDSLTGGLDDDTIRGSGGEDTLIGDTLTPLTFRPATLAIAEDHEMTLTFDAETAGTRNTIGVYKIDPATGTISDIQIVWETTALSGATGSDTSVTIPVSAGEDVGFFLIGNGIALNDFTALARGEFGFFRPDGTPAQITDTAPALRHIAPDGGVTAIQGHIYHSTGSLSALNPDEIDHTLGHTGSETGLFQIGFEDVFGGGDLDFDDAVFTVDLGAANGAAILEALAIAQEEGGNDRLHGNEGDDQLEGKGGNDLLVGGGASTEWRLIDGEWVYDPGALRNPAEIDPHYAEDGADDILIGGRGRDVLLGNAGDDTLYGGDGRDRLYGHRGTDQAYGGLGDDRGFLGRGDDSAQGGAGADTIGGDAGNDLIYGDTADGNILRGDGTATTFAAHGKSGSWATEEDGSLSQQVHTIAGEAYTLSLDIAANLPAGVTAGAVEVLWNDTVIDRLESSSGVFETHRITIKGTGEAGTLTLRDLGSEDVTVSGPPIDTSGLVHTYDREVTLGGETVAVKAFAPGQAKLLQVVEGQLMLFDPSQNDYTVGGAPTGLGINAIGYNIEDDLIYGIAKQKGTDALGNPVSVKDVVVLDATGQAYRVGKGPTGDYVGDFDSQGNLWTFDASFNRITRIDVDNFDDDGNPVAENIYLPNDLVLGRVQDIAYNAEEQAFYAVQTPAKNGEAGKIIRIDVANFDAGGVPGVTSYDVSGTLVDGIMKAGMPKGDYGAVFLDGEGTLYAGLNKGDHDLGDAAVSGGIYRMSLDPETGQAFAELLADAPKVGRNDGAADPRAVSPFAEIDTGASLQIRLPDLQLAAGGDDSLMGGTGSDTLAGGGGNDTVQGGADDDIVRGDAGDDRVMGNAGDDLLEGGAGDDFLSGGSGRNTLEGGAGDDRMAGGGNADTLHGGDGDDRLWGKDGNDMALGGAGDDHLTGNGGGDLLDGGQGNDDIHGGAGADTLIGGQDDDLMQGAAGADVLEGGAGADKLVGGAGADTISGGGGKDHIWGGDWSGDGTSDTFAYQKGGSTDTVHDFEAAHDRIDLSAYNLTYEEVEARLIDRGWATEINLENIDKSGAGDKIYLKEVSLDELDETNFII